jgi:hypothetical protein
MPWGKSATTSLSAPDGAPSSSPLNSIRRGGPNASRANDQIPTPPGIDVDGIAGTEADHFMKCPGCGEWFGMRNLDQMLTHVHDGEIEMEVGPGPQPREDPVQPMSELGGAILTVRRRLPVCTDERTSSGPVGMSQTCQ